MTSSSPVDPELEVMVQDPHREDRKRRLLLLILLMLSLALCGVVYIGGKYLIEPKPLLDILIPKQAPPGVVVTCYQPAYKFSIEGVDAPVAVAVSPDNQRIYVAESEGERMVKMFDRDGNLVLRFAPPGTDRANREPKYLAVDSQGRVFVVDSTSNAIDIYSPDGKFLDAIIGQNLTLTSYLASKTGQSTESVALLHYEGINKLLTYQFPGQDPQQVKIEFTADQAAWFPLGVRFDAEGNLLVTDLSAGAHSVKVIPAASLSGSLSAYAPSLQSFGDEGNQKQQFSYPQVAIKDEQGNFYVSDGNNSRVSIWTPDLKYKTFFGFGSDVGALNLPRGLALNRSCLLVSDAVGSVVRVYDVSGKEPKFAFDIGAPGVREGEFNYPIDVFLDGTGRLYVADRANNRIQVWSY